MLVKEAQTAMRQYSKTKSSITKMLKVSDVYSDSDSLSSLSELEYDSEEESEIDQLKEFWKSMSPPTLEEDIIGQWYAVAYKSKKSKKESLYIGKATKRFLEDENGRVKELELNFLKPHVGNTTILEEYPGGQQDVEICKLTDVLGGPLNVSYQGNGKWNVHDLLNVQNFLFKLRTLTEVVFTDRVVFTGHTGL